MRKNIGFMQGRLSQLVDGKIQAFPWLAWQEEFFKASKIPLNMMEWTLDYPRLDQNPLMTISGREEITYLKNKYSVAIPSLTGDCFMQKPFWKASAHQSDALKGVFISVVEACYDLGIGLIVLPLVDGGRIENTTEEDTLIEFFQEKTVFLRDKRMKVAFESDFPPERLKVFVSNFSDDVFGVNYDSGNSASQGFVIEDEFSAYGNRIINVHIKDRKFAGETVPLGMGAVNFNNLFRSLNDIRYSGNFILQTARADDGRHVATISRYADLVAGWVDRE